MDADRFDALSRMVMTAGSRRDLLRGLAAAPFGLLLARLPDLTSAKNKNKKKPLQRNDFGCLNLGQPCGGKKNRCCSGVCKGKKPKKGKRDTRTCAAHDTGGCSAARSICDVGSFQSICGPGAVNAHCLATTGNAGFCVDSAIVSPSNCRPCGKDADCEALGFPGGSACVIIAGEPGSACSGMGTCQTSDNPYGTACVPPLD